MNISNLENFFVSKSKGLVLLTGMVFLIQPLFVIADANVASVQQKQNSTEYITLGSGTSTLVRANTNTVVTCAKSEVADRTCSIKIENNSRGYFCIVQHSNKISACEQNYEDAAQVLKEYVEKGICESINQ